MYYCVYETRNKINGKIYIGVHRTQNLNDDYLGSGKRLNNAIKKYGRENFSRTILEIFNSEELAYSREKEIVNESFLEREDVYNLKPGGTGGFKDPSLSGYRGAKLLSERMTSEERKIRGRNARAAVKNLNSAPGLAKANTPEAIAKKKLTWEKTGRGKGEKSSSYGTMWITDGIKSQKIKKDQNIPAGWFKGRKM